MRSMEWRHILATLSILVVLGGCSSTKTSESTGEYVDDAVVTAKVKEAIIADNGLKGFQIGVETFKDEVQLSGFVDTADMKSHATTVAQGVRGVRAVHNNLIVK